MPSTQSMDLVHCLKRVAAALRDAGLPFALGGGLAVWARGGPPSAHDVDLMVARADGARALEVLEAVGLRTEVPPEGWLLKAYDGDILIDLIHEPCGLVIDHAYIEHCERISVAAVSMPVMSATDVLTTSVTALNAHQLDLARVLPMARALREQIDWVEVWKRSAGNPYAKGFMTMVTELGLVDADAMALMARSPHASG